MRITQSEAGWFCGLVDGPCPTDQWLAHVEDPRHGAINTFYGVVRNHNEGQAAASVDYDVHEGLALKALAALCTEIVASLPVRLYVIHSCGMVAVGEASVVIAASSAHRAEAFEATRRCIDQLKIRVPIWKREIAPDQSDRWLDGHTIRVD
jgi:molybdopterin synthase catalytic subunit